MIVDMIGKLPVHASKTYGTRPLGAIARIAVHHTAGPATQTPVAIARFHVDGNGWPGIGYHYLVGPDGTAYKCWPATTISYCVAKGNTPSLCVCLIGNFTAAPPPSLQWGGAALLVRDLAVAYGLTRSAIFGHRETPTNPPQSTACPGKTFDCEAFRRAVFEASA